LRNPGFRQNQNNLELIADLKIMIKIILNKKKSFKAEDHLSLFEIFKQQSPQVLNDTLAARLDDELIDLSRPLEKGGEIELITFGQKEGKEIFWHSSSHLMAQAIKELFPRAKLAIGPAIEDGFYYDIDFDHAINSDDLVLLEQRMQELSQKKIAIKREELSKAEAIKLFSDLNETYKVELLQEMGDDEVVSIYRQGDFVDLCRGPHLLNTGYIKHFKLLNVAGAYWHGDEKNKMLQRIYGIAFPKKTLLEEYLRLLEEAKKRDHRKLGKELELFSVNDEIGAGLILWHPKGAQIRHLIEQFWKDEHFKAGYELLYTPHIAKLDLWRQSGHVDFYRENMYSPMLIDDVEYEIKPMNCPFHIMIYKSKIRSYRELPIRWAELGTVYRYERSGVLHGMLRVRGFTQDDAHIFCRPDQITDEILHILDFTMFFLRTFGFSEYKIFLSTRPEKSVGSDDHWDLATHSLENALKTRNLNYEIDPGEGVFYGPKIDIKIKDVLKRYWQCTTIQVDFNNPERFSVEYIGDDGHTHRPIMIHRALLGSLERFFGILIEQYGGAFPVWLAPVQVILLPITEKQHVFAQNYFDLLRAKGIRAQLDNRSEKIGYKIRDAETQKIPYMLIMGEKEAANNMVAVRKRRQGDIGQMSFENFVLSIQNEISGKSLLT